MATTWRCAVLAPVVLAAAGATSACSHPTPAPSPAPASTSATSPATSTGVPPKPSAEPSAPEPRTIKWVDLAVGDCTTAVPAVELGEVTATVADCAGPHAAEVYLLAPIAVNTALADVANQVCTDGLPGYAT